MQKRALRRKPVRAAAGRRPPREEARRARNDLYRQHILGAAEHVFAERGFESAKVQEISDRAGLSMGTIYALFPSKSDLLQAILDQRGGDILARARDVAARQLPPLDGLRALIRDYIEYFVAHPNFLRMHLRQGSSWVLSPTPDTATRVQMWREVHGLQTEIFRRGVESGTFVDEEPAFLARLFSAMDQVLLADWVESGMRADHDALIERLQRLVERTFCR
jgi:AcrR family transcriptional regulator